MRLSKLDKKKINFFFSSKQSVCVLWQYGLWSFQTGSIKSERFLPKNQWKIKGNFWILRIGLKGSLSSLQKSEFLKFIISFFYYFRCQNWDQWHKWVEKTPIYFFQLLVQKVNKFERKKSEKNEKNPKTLKLQAITLTSNTH